jgi:hypothetical protein
MANGQMLERAGELLWDQAKRARELELELELEAESKRWGGICDSGAYMVEESMKRGEVLTRVGGKGSCD